jgi:hypothetical protein
MDVTKGINAFYIAIVVLQEKAGFTRLAIPNVMLTVLGVVIGFVISYRASSGLVYCYGDWIFSVDVEHSCRYDRYWMGRTCWSDVIKHSRVRSFHLLRTQRLIRVCVDYGTVDLVPCSSHSDSQDCGRESWRKVTEKLEGDAEGHG